MTLWPRFGPPGAASQAVVVGAGPAGAVAALVLARAGVRVRLIDRARFPRHKLCGDTLNPGALSILDKLASPGVPRGTVSVSDAVRARALPITGMTVTGPRGATVTGLYPAHLLGAALTRSDLDLVLLDAAVAAGAEFEPGVRAIEPVTAEGRIDGVRVAGASGERTMPAGIVIAADGRGSRLASKLRLAAFARHPRRWAFGAYFTGVHGLTSCGEMHIRPGGYVGVAPLPGGVANVCVVREMVPGRSTAGVDRRRIIDDALAAEPVLRERFAAARRVSDVVSLGPLAVDASGAGAPGVLLAGDAAGFVDPMTGDGLRFALRGGMLAAEAALSELATGRPAHVRLHAARAREFAGKWRLNRALRFVTGSPRLLALLAVAAGHWSHPVRHLIGMAADLDVVNGRTPCE